MLKKKGKGSARAPGSKSKHGTFDHRSEFIKQALAGGVVPVAEIAGEKRVLNGTPDVPDLRDKMYNATLQDLKPSILPPNQLIILNQKSEGACTGFALAAVINRLHQLRDTTGSASLASPRMLYELAKQHDEWAGENYQGSSIRGALKGFFHNGVCSEVLAPYKSGQKDWSLTVEMAKDARNVGLGAYYRIRPDIIAYHGALTEVGIICASARVHEGWKAPVNGKIVVSKHYTGGHAFAIVGYDDTGFFVQNSWGPKWGGGGGLAAGIAHWSYEDWAENAMDAWVLRLAVPTPQSFDVIRSRSSFAIDSALAERVSDPPRRQEIAGHIVNIDDGLLQPKGRYGTPVDSFKETGELIAKKTLADGTPAYKHIMFFAHGGLNSLEDGAQRASALIEPFKRNGIYPFFFLWGTAFLEEFGDALKATFDKAQDRVGGLTDFTDAAIEQMTRPLGRAVWRQIKRDAEMSFAPKQENGLAALQALMSELKPADAGGPQIHLVGHSAGSILLGHMLQAMTKHKIGSQVATAQLMAPACTTDHYQEHYQTALARKGPGGLKTLRLYNLSKERELDDNVLDIYQKSLLYLVSNSCEEERGMPLLGMQLHADALKLPKDVVSYAGHAKAVTDSETHGGFDNDLATMNSLLRVILGALFDKSKAFEPHEVEGY